MNNPGFIYFLTNPSMPGVVKIGCSYHPRRRVEELSAASGVPTPFKLEFFQFVLDSQFIEQTLHRMLIRFRVSPDREFFRIDLDTAIKIFSDWLCHSGLHPVHGQDFEIIDGLVCVSHEGGIPVQGHVDLSLTPEIRFIFERSGHPELWDERVGQFAHLGGAQ